MRIRTRTRTIMLHSHVPTVPCVINGLGTLSVALNFLNSVDPLSTIS